VGKIELYNEDNMQLMARYPDKYFDLAIVDPPYGIERFKTAQNETTGVYAKRGSWKVGDAENWNNEKPSKEYFEQLFRVSKNQIIWGANNFELPTTEYFCVWDKQQYMPNFASAELAWVSMGLKKPAKVFRYSIHQENANREKEGGKFHPTQKPIKLYEWLLMNYAKEGDKILDTHLGSGSIAIACHDLHFDLVACEIDKEYYDKALEKYEIRKSQLKLF
jgi:site-specific DNA-methyltransferase (adenine-specific)